MARPPKGVIPLYLKIVQEIREDIRACRIDPGQRIDSINELQRKHGIARETAKRVLNMLESEGLIVQKAGKGSFVTDLSPLSARWAALVSTPTPANRSLLAALAQEAAQADRTFSVHCSGGDVSEEARLLALLTHERYEGVFLIHPKDPQGVAKFAEKLGRFGTRIAVLATEPIPGLLGVVEAMGAGLGAALSYLGWVRGGMAGLVLGNAWPGERGEDDPLAVALAGSGAASEVLVFNSTSDIDGAMLRERGIASLVCSDGLAAIEVIGRLGEAGLRPHDDYNLVAYGDSAIAQGLEPPLTVVDPKYGEIAAALCMILRGSEETPEPEAATWQVIEPELVIRGT